MSSIGASGGIGAAFPSPLDSDHHQSLDLQSDLDRLAGHVSSLDRLVADAGSLAKFRADQSDALPSGTSSFTTPTANTMAHIETRMASPNERVLGSTQLQPRREPVPAAIESERARMQSPELPAGLHLTTPRASVETDAENRAAALLHGNRPVPEA